MHGDALDVAFGQLKKVRCHLSKETVASADKTPRKEIGTSEDLEQP